MLRVEGLSKTYADGTRALNNVSFKVEQGEFVVILGRSGSGKSTLLRCINRLVEPGRGRVFLDDQEITQAGTKQLRKLRRRIGMIFQHYNLVRRASVLTNVLTGRLGFVSSWFGLINHFPRQSVEDARGRLRELGVLEKAAQRADALSGGQQQRVGIARALMQDPHLILADEPVSSLDPATSRTILDILLKINRDRGVTLLCNLHIPELALEYGERILGLKAGQLIFDGSANSLDKNRIRDLYGSDPPVQI